MADSTNWDKNRPAGSEFQSAGDDLMRADKAILEATLEEEHIFKDTPAEAGKHRAGSARIYVGTAAELAAIVAASPDEGRMFFDTDNDELHILGAGATYVLKVNDPTTVVVSATEPTSPVAGMIWVKPTA